MRPEPNTPPTWLYRVALSFNIEDADEDATPAQREVAEMLAQAVWDALHAHGETVWRDDAVDRLPLQAWIAYRRDMGSISSAFTPLLVVPLGASPEPHA